MFNHLSQTRFFIKLLVGGWIAVFFAWAIDLPPTHALFLVYYTLLCFQSSIGATFSVARAIIIWSTIGIFVGMVSAVLLQYSLGTAEFVIWILLAIIVLFGAYSMPKGPEARLGFVSALLVGVLGNLSTSPWEEALLRACILFCALILGLVISLLIFPTQASDIVKDQILKVSYSSIELLSASMDHALNLDHADPKTRWPEKKMLNQIFSLRQELIQSQHLIRFVKKDKNHTDEYLQFLIHHQGRILNYIVFFIRTAKKNGKNGLIQEFSNDFFGIYLHLQHSLRFWISLIEKENSFIDLNPLELIYKKINRNIKKQDLNQLHTKNLIAFFSFYRDLQSFAHDMNRLIEQTKEKNGFKEELDGFVALS